MAAQNKKDACAGCPWSGRRKTGANYCPFARCVRLGRGLNRPPNSTGKKKPEGDRRPAMDTGPKRGY